MLSAKTDKPTIRNAIFKRFTDDLGIIIADIAFKDLPDGVRVNVWLLDSRHIQTAGLLDIQGQFDLPEQFQHSHLLNELDEIAEGVKEARRKTGIAILVAAPTYRQPVKGTGLRGRWAN